MAQPVRPGSYTALFSQRLIATILQLATTNPLAAGNAGNAGGVIPQLDGMLLQNVSSMDGMLATVGLQVNSGLAPTNAGNAGTLGQSPLGIPQAGLNPQGSGLTLNNPLSLTG